MSIYTVTEDKYKESTWCKRTLDGLLRRAKQSKINVIISNTDCPAESGDSVVIIGTTPAWIYTTIKNLSESTKAAVILISNRPYQLPVNNVCTDIYSATGDVMTYLSDCGKSNIALYGVNPSSTSDNLKLLRFGSNDVYYNTNGLNECWSEFRLNLDKYDAVICTNDYAAVSLTDNLKKENPSESDRLFIVSFANTHLGKLNTPSITSVALNYDEYGKAAVELYNLLRKNPYLQNVNINIKSSIIVRESTHNIPLKSGSIGTVRCDSSSFDFYSDSEVKKLLKAELIFENCSESDLTVLKLMADGKSYEQTAEAVFMTVNGIKYRIKRLCGICGFSGRKELLEFVKKHI